MIYWDKRLTFKHNIKRLRVMYKLNKRTYDEQMVRIIIVGTVIIILGLLTGTMIVVK